MIENRRGDTCPCCGFRQRSDCLQGYQGTGDQPCPNRPPAGYEFVGARRLPLLTQFAKFGAVGLCGFVVDTSIVYALRGLVGLYWAGIVSYLVAATFNWCANRMWTFRGTGAGPAHRQWVRYLGANTIGFLLNRGTYTLLIAFVPACAHQPVFATFAGALAGMLVNFKLSRLLVFR